MRDTEPVRFQPLGTILHRINSQADQMLASRYSAAFSPLANRTVNGSTVPVYVHGFAREKERLLDRAR